MSSLMGVSLGQTFEDLVSMVYHQTTENFNNSCNQEIESLHMQNFDQVKQIGTKAWAYLRGNKTVTAKQISEALRTKGLINPMCYPSYADEDYTVLKNGRQEIYHTKAGTSCTSVMWDEGNQTVDIINFAWKGENGIKININSYIGKTSQTAAAHPAAELAGHARRRRIKPETGWLISSKAGFMPFIPTAELWGIAIK